MADTSKSVNDKIALERHDFIMRALKSVFTLGIFLVIVFFVLYLYSLSGDGELPSPANLIGMVEAIFSALTSAL